MIFLGARPSLIPFLLKWRLMPVQEITKMADTARNRIFFTGLPHVGADSRENSGQDIILAKKEHI